MSFNIFLNVNQSNCNWKDHIYLWLEIVHDIFFVELDSITVEERKSLIKEGFSLLPPAHYQTLKYLLSHLAR